MRGDGTGDRGLKRPAFQFYPADWRKDAALQSCSIGARGVWHELLCVMHECRPYGHLTLNGKPMEVAAVCRLIGVDQREYSLALRELESVGVFSREDDGTIFSRRMIRDEHIRAVRAEAGRHGGNPKLLNHEDKQKEPRASLLLNQPDNQGPNLGLTPSSSSAFASSSALHSVGTVEPDCPPRSNFELAATAPKKAAKRINGESHGTRLAEGWALPDEWKRWALAFRSDWNEERAQRESLVFRDHWLAKAGKDARKASWLATWRNWVRRSD